MNFIPVDHNFKASLIEIEPDNEIAGAPIYLRNVFEAIITESKIKLKKLDIKFILENDLKIEFTHGSSEIVDMFTDAFVFCCEDWKQMKSRNEMLQNETYITFRLHLVNKYLSIFHTVNNLYKTNPKSDFSHETQPKFTIGNELSVTDIPLTNKQNENLWTNLSMIEFLNWPQVGVEIEVLDIHLKRFFVLNQVRHFPTNKNNSVFQDDIIKYVSTKSQTNSSYTSSFFIFYFNELSRLMGNVPAINPNRLKETSHIFTEILKDIKELNIAMGSMQTDTSVGFRIGKQTYHRTNSDVSGDRTPINTEEDLEPVVTLSLEYFKGQQDLNECGSTSFKSINALLKKIDLGTDTDLLNFSFNVNNTCITYYCTICNFKFCESQAYAQITAHFSKMHKIESAVFCNVCKKEFEVIILAGNRWSHKCI